MSYDIELQDPSTGKPVIVERHFEGGTYCVSGHGFAELNITYNYSKYYYDKIDKDLGIRWLYNKTGEECIPVLEKAVNDLGVNKNENYWESTPGNAGYALSILLKWAKSYPKAVFEGD